MSYRPLPDYLTIKESSINGLGLFATEKINANLLIGVTHHRNEHSEDGYIRTPLGDLEIILMILIVIKY